jgi:type I restriction enzyme M protein
MTSERDIEALIDWQLKARGWQPYQNEAGRNVFRQAPKSGEERAKLGRLRPDFILYADADSGRATAIIEAKKPNKPLALALEQGKQYAKLLNAPIVVATDGYILKTWHLPSNAPLFFNSGEVDEIFSPELALHFARENVYQSFGKDERVGKRELIKKFGNANDILREEGLDAGIVRFSEFANLMFLKLWFETENKNKARDLGGITWDDVEKKRGQEKLNAVKSALTSLRQRHSSLFEQTKIKSPENLEKLVDILASFRLSGVRDDIKGMAFEYFIHSYTQGTGNDLGQYFTPRHIIKMMVDYLRPQLGETVYDPFCGTGGMLIECYRYIQQHGIKNEREDRRLRERTVYGRDISSVARIAMMNMIMFGDGHSNVEQGDSYKRGNAENHDVVIANIPFSQSTRHTEGYPVCPKSGQNGDSIGAQHCLVSLKNSEHSRAAIIVPIGFIYKSDLSAEREHIARNFYLERVVELTPKCFNPYTEQQTAVLMLRQRARRLGKTIYYRVKKDGFSQDGYRVPIAGSNDIDDVMDGVGGERAQIDEKNEWRYKTIAPALRKNEKRLRDLATVKKGDGISPKTMLHYIMGGARPIMMVADLAVAHIDYCLNESRQFINDLAIKEKRPFLFPKNAIVIPSSGKAALKNHRALLAMPSYLSSTLTGVVANPGVSPHYLFYCLLHWDAEEGTYDLGYPGLSTKEIGDIPIPILPKREEEAIVKKVVKLAELQAQFKKAHRALTKNNSQ